MRPRIKGAWIAAGIAVLGAMAAGGLETQAGTVTLKGGIQEGSGSTGDPPYTYYFDLYLTGGSIAPDGGSLTCYFTVNGLVGASGIGYDPSQIGTPSTPSEPPYTATPGSVESTEYWITPNGGVATSPSPIPPGFMANGYNYESNVTWEYLLGPTIPYSNPGPNGVFLGLFTVNTSWSYGKGQPPPLAPGSILTYSYDINGTTGTGLLVLQGVPEPSSMVLMLLGAAAVPPAVALHRRGSRSRRVDG
jgi:hypothetical protein